MSSFRRLVDAAAARVRRDDRTEAPADEGMAMVMCMVFIILGMLVVTPLLGYA